MTEQDILKTVISVTKAASDQEEVTEESSFMDDLEMASVEIYVMLADLEAAFSIHIPERLLGRIGTVRDMAEEIGRLLGVQHG